MTVDVLGTGIDFLKFGAGAFVIWWAARELVKIATERVRGDGRGRW